MSDQVVLGDSDIRAVLDAASALAADPLPTTEVALDLLRSLIPCVSASFNDMTLATGDFRYVIVPPDEVELAARLKPVYDRLAHEHLLITFVQQQPSVGAVRFCDVPDGERFTSTALYREFFEPFGIRYQLAIRLPSPPDVIVGHALNRGPDQGEFSDRDVEVLNALAAHLAMHHRRTLDLARACAIDDDALSDDGWAVVTVRSDGVVEGSSSWSPSSSLTRGGVVPQAIVDLLPSRGDVGVEPNVHDLTIEAERWRCVVNPVAAGPTVLLVRKLGDERAEATPLIDLGLTPRQTEIALALAQTGGSNSHLARSLRISEGTVKKHLESVFRALGVESRAAAVAVLRAAASQRP